MNFLQILQLILSLAPQGITLTQEIVAIITEIETVLGTLPAQSQAPVAAVVAKALVAKV